MQKILAWVVVVLVVVWAIFAFMDKQKQDVAPLADTSTVIVQSQDEIPATDTSAIKATISYTNSGFSPATITIKKGTEVVFSNESGRDSWPASAIHPAHTVYPGSSITKCGTPDASKIFDACVGIKSGSAWSFVFNEVGSWNYHDHLKSSDFGTVVVTE